MTSSIMLKWWRGVVGGSRAQDYRRDSSSFAYHRGLWRRDDPREAILRGHKWAINRNVGRSISNERHLHSEEQNRAQAKVIDHLQHIVRMLIETIDRESQHNASNVALLNEQITSFQVQLNQERKTVEMLCGEKITIANHLRSEMEVMSSRLESSHMNLKAAHRLHQQMMEMSETRRIKAAEGFNVRINRVYATLEQDRNKRRREQEEAVRSEQKMSTQIEKLTTDLERSLQEKKRIEEENADSLRRYQEEHSLEMRRIEHRHDQELMELTQKLDEAVKMNGVLQNNKRVQMKVAKKKADEEIARLNRVIQENQAARRSNHQESHNQLLQDIKILKAENEDLSKQLREHKRIREEEQHRIAEVFNGLDLVANKATLQHQEVDPKEDNLGLGAECISMNTAISDVIETGKVGQAELVPPAHLLMSEPQCCSVSGPCPSLPVATLDHLVPTSHYYNENGRWSRQWASQVKAYIERFAIHPDRIRMKAKLGAGGFGQGFAATLMPEQHNGKSHPVFVKVFQNMDDPEMERRFNAAIENAAYISAGDSKNFAHKFLGFCTNFPQKGQCAMISQRINGVDLHKMLTQQVVPMFERFEIVEQVIDRVSWLHCVKKMFWGDLKFANLMSRWPLVRGSRLKLFLIDLDSCEPFERGRVCRSNTFTEGWSAPEVAGRLKSDIGPAADVFSIGRLIKELFCKEKRPRHKSRRDESVMDAMEALGDQCMSFLPDQRITLLDLQSSVKALMR